MAKVDRIINLLETRISRGDYALTAFPSEVRLAEEIGASRTTIRNATVSLIEKGLLQREVTGRLVVAREPSPVRPIHIGFLMPALNPATMQWSRIAETMVHAHGGHVRTATFFHWNDPVLLDAIQSFDGIFLVPPAEALPEDLAEKLRTARARLVVLADYSALGIHSVNLVHPDSVQGLMDHLATLGHQRIAAFNTQPMVTVIQQRLEKWQVWLDEHECSGELVNEPEPSYGHPLERAYAVAKERLTRGVGFGGTAVFCTTMPAALGLMRAMYEQGLKVGQDISICCAFDEGTAQFLCPPLTSIQMAAPDALLQVCVDWMAGGEWQGPMCLRAPNAEIFKGDSTGPVPLTLALYHQGLTDLTHYSSSRRNTKKTVKQASPVKKQPQLIS